MYSRNEHEKHTRTGVQESFSTTCPRPLDRHGYETEVSNPCPLGWIPQTFWKLNLQVPPEKIKLSTCLHARRKLTSINHNLVRVPCNNRLMNNLCCQSRLLVWRSETKGSCKQQHESMGPTFDSFFPFNVPHLAFIFHMKPSKLSSFSP